MSSEVSLEKSNELHVDQNRGYYLPGDRSFTEGISILGRHELSKGKEVVFSITPRDCYRVCGDELLTAPVVVTPPLVNTDGYTFGLLAYDALTNANPSAYWRLSPDGTNAVTGELTARFFRLGAEEGNIGVIK